MNKKNPLLLIPMLCLASCSKVGYAGTYAFQMGKAGSTNIRLALTLTEQPVVDEEQGVNGKMFTIDANLPNTALEDVLSSLDYDFDLDIQDATELITSFIDILSESLTLYYNVGTIVRPQGTQLKFGALLNSEETGIDIPNELIENIVCAYITTSSLTLQIPVSLDDLRLQLCWYGLYVNFDSSSVENMIVSLDHEKLPGTQGEERFGSHPTVLKDGTKNEVIDMNVNFAKEFSNTPVYENALSSKIIGYIAKLPDNNMYFYKNEDVSITSANLSAAINLKNEYHVFNNRKEVNLTIDPRGGVDKTSFELIEIKDVESESILEEEEYYQKPFVFRDFHDIRVGLARE